MKVALYQCGGEAPRNEVPLGIGYLLANCGKPGVDLVWARTRDELKSADMIGLSANAQGLKEAVDICLGAKVPCVIGGQGTLWPGLTKYPFMYIVVGEGERAFQAILEGDAGPLRVIRHPNVEDLDGIKPPVRGTCDPVAPIMSSRGCPFHCRYCSSQAYWQRVRYHSAGRIISEVDEIERTQPEAQIIYFLDDLMTANKKRLKQLHKLWVTRGFHRKYRVWTFVRADTFNADTAAILRDMNTARVRFGAESGCDRVLKVLGKTTTVADNARCLAIGREFKLNMSASFMYDIPGETVAEAEQTKAFIAEHQVQVEGWYRYTPFPGCDLYDGTDPLKEQMRFRPKPGREDFEE